MRSNERALRALRSQVEFEIVASAAEVVEAFAASSDAASHVTDCESRCESVAREIREALGSTAPSYSSDAPAITSSDLTVASGDSAVTSGDPTVGSVGPAITNGDPTLGSVGPAIASGSPTLGSDGLAITSSDPTVVPTAANTHLGISAETTPRQLNPALLATMRDVYREERALLRDSRTKLTSARKREQAARDELAELRNRERSLESALSAERRKQDAKYQIAESIVADELWLQHLWRERA